MKDFHKIVGRDEKIQLTTKFTKDTKGSDDPSSQLRALRELLRKYAERTQDPHPSRKRARVHIGYTSEKKSPRPFRWERARACPGRDPGVRAISLLVGERKLMNHFVVKKISIWLRRRRDVVQVFFDLSSPATLL